jgi:hypothetical protein
MTMKKLFLIERGYNKSDAAVMIPRLLLDSKGQRGTDTRRRGSITRDVAGKPRAALSARDAVA